jgi:predicted AAA+ superfamily ATPase
LRGAVFENWVVSEAMKAACNQGERPRLYFWRDSAGLEIDLIQERTESLSAVEIKSGATFSPDWITSLNKRAVLAASGNLTTMQTVIYGGDEHYTFKGVTVRPWKQTGESMKVSSVR